MSSQLQIDANRRNAQRSTGPRTPEGRAKVANNGRPRSLSSRNAGLPPQAPAEFQALLDGLRAIYQPANEAQESSLRELAWAEWRLRGVVRIETGLFTYRMERARETELSPEPPPLRHNRESQTRFPERTHHAPQSQETKPLTTPRTNPPAALQPPSPINGARPSAGGGMLHGSARRRRHAARQCPTEAACCTAVSAGGDQPALRRPSTKARHDSPNEPTVDPNPQETTPLTHPKTNPTRTQPPPFGHSLPNAGARPSAGGGKEALAPYPRPACPRSLSSTDRGTATFPLIPVPNWIPGLAPPWKSVPPVTAMPSLRASSRNCATSCRLWSLW